MHYPHLIKFFEDEYVTPLLKVKYILDCPYCNDNVTTFFNKKEIPNYEVECLENHCDPFIPSLHPEKINIYFELLDQPIIDEEDVLGIFEKKGCSPL
ncbi:hypothetical protein RCO48_04415 [Peribacillus frigoritolerans]|nr:hypothetical protein [Peribacillus frigoritolerans]